MISSRYLDLLNMYGDNIETIDVHLLVCLVQEKKHTYDFDGF